MEIFERTIKLIKLKCRNIVFNALVPSFQNRFRFLFDDDDDDDDDDDHSHIMGTIVTNDIAGLLSCTPYHKRKKTANRR